MAPQVFDVTLGSPCAHAIAGTAHGKVCNTHIVIVGALLPILPQFSGVILRSHFEHVMFHALLMKWCVTNVLEEISSNPLYILLQIYDKCKLKNGIMNGNFLLSL